MNILFVASTLCVLVVIALPAVFAVARFRVGR
jgi:hypothetical protein